MEYNECLCNNEIVVPWRFWLKEDMTKGGSLEGWSGRGEGGVVPRSLLRSFYLGKLSGLDLGYEGHEYTNTLAPLHFQ